MRSDRTLSLVVARNVRARRIDAQWSVDTLACRAGLSCQRVLAVEQGDGQVTIAELSRIAQALSVTTDVLLKDDVKLWDVGGSSK